MTLEMIGEDRDCDGLEHELAVLFNISLKKVK